MKLNSRLFWSQNWHSLVHIGLLLLLSSPGRAQADTLIPLGAIWSYLDNGTDAGTAWVQTNYNDSAWLKGPTQLGFGDGDEQTIINGGPSGGRYATTYFRNTFVVTDRADITNLALLLLRDDGAIVYLNGVEVFRSNMPDEPATYTTWAAWVVEGSEESTFFPAAILPDLLMSGTNVIAVEIHQSDPGSSDLSFSLELLANTPFGNLPPPTTLSVASNNLIVAVGEPFILNTSASDPETTVTRIDLYQDGTPIQTIFGNAGQVTWSNAVPGIHDYFVRATDTAGAVGASPAVRVLVTNPGLQAQSVFFSQFPSASGLLVQNNASISSNVLHLTHASVGSRGGALLAAQQPVSGGFVTEFRFRIICKGGGGADGLAFLIAGTSQARIGTGLGYNGITNSIAVEFDTWLNSNLGDPNDHHISVHSRGPLANTSDESASLGLYTPPNDFSDGLVHKVRIDYVPGTLRVFLDNLITPVLTVAVDLGTLLSLPTGNAWIALTAGSGSSFENHDISAWSYTGLPTNLVITLTAPADKSAFVSGTSITAAGAVLNGIAPFKVTYFTNSGTGNVIFDSAGSSATAPFSVSLGSPPVGAYNIYAVVTDSSGIPASTNSVTNSFFVVDPIAVTLTAPANEESFVNPTSLPAMATVSGGTAPYLVQYYADNLTSGGPAASPPYSHDLGLLASGDHTIWAAVTDAHGWVSNSTPSLIHVIDTIPPSITSVIANDLNTMVVTFSEPVEPASATNAANYRVVPTVTIMGFQMLNSTTVVVTTAARDVQLDYTLTVAGVRDNAVPANASASGTPFPLRRRNRGTSGGLAGIQTVFLIIFENEDWSTIKGNPDAPYLNSLLAQSSYCEQYYAHNNQHPSEPNYIYLEAGTNFGFTDDIGPSVDRLPSTNHLTTLLNNAGIDWRGYMESMPPGSTGTADSGEYVGRHDPFAFFNDVISNYNYATNHLRPYSYFSNDLAFNRIGRYNFITPNLTNDMHDLAPGSTNTVRQGDAWLAQELPRILGSAAFSNNGAIFLTFDESGGGSANPIMMMVLSPLARGGGYASTTFYDHGSTLRTLQDIYGVRPYLGDAGNAPSLAELFKALTLTVTVSNGLAGVTIYDAVPGQRNFLQTSPDLVQWATIATNVANGSVAISEPNASDLPRQFYRVIEAP